LVFLPLDGVDPAIVAALKLERISEGELKGNGGVEGRGKQQKSISSHPHHPLRLGQMARPSSSYNVVRIPSPPSISPISSSPPLPLSPISSSPSPSGSSSSSSPLQPLPLISSSSSTSTSTSSSTDSYTSFSALLEEEKNGKRQTQQHQVPPSFYSSSFPFPYSRTSADSSSLSSLSSLPSLLSLLLSLLLLPLLPQLSNTLHHSP
jgi:hypothetical protein